MAHARSSLTHIYSMSDDSPTVLLPPPSFGIPISRPYTSATMASARTYVDPDAEIPVPPEGVDAELETEAGPPQIPQTSLTFLLVSGRRRTMSFEPDTTVGRVKELVWNAWPSEWQDERPPAPSYLRILYLGKILQDDDTLAELSLPSHSTPSPSPSHSTPPLPQTTIVHLIIRPYAPPSGDDALKKKRKSLILRMGGAGGGVGGVGEEDGERGCCGGCVIC
ncbi:hypothetical protein PILCRDRAFT_64096 [Piloderma croceum F 1598]|uniref:Ubiquitin-like domain-containing protein n=1 Tax=Piloderma croceum (strain F 1598) TaxID=765440 RepID=A0A0C3BKF9_PILCF|nr:hypothetical protein PILCRDRAFT_64096 [Piloderma croceum F 1598]